MTYHAGRRPNRARVPHDRAGCLARRQVRSERLARASERHAGARAAHAHAGGARPGGGAQDGGLCHGLSRLAARGGRSADDTGGGRSGPGRHPLSARPQRGSGGDGDLGHPAGASARRGAGRGGLRALVWQGAGGGPVGRRDAPRQHGGQRGAWRGADGDGRRPHGRILDHAAPVRRRHDRGGDAGALARGCAGDPRLRPLRLCAVALFRPLGRAQDHEGHSRIHGRRRWQTGADGLHPARFPHARGRRHHPPHRHPAGAGGAAPCAEAARGAGVRARKRHRPARLGRRGGAHRPHGRGQELARPAIGARAARARCRGSSRARHHHAQGRAGLAARTRGVAGMGRGARGHPLRRGKAQADRGAGQGDPLQHPRRLAHHRRARPRGRGALARELRARPRADRPCHRPHARGRGGADRGARGRARAARGRHARRRRNRDRDAAALFLRGLPAQLLNPRARGQPRLRRHRLPLHGPVDGPRDAGLHPHGRRGRELDRRGALLDPRACVPEHGRWHLQPFGRAGDPRGHRGGNDHHLQDPLQRRRRHDGRAGQRRRADGGADRA